MAAAAATIVNVAVAVAVNLLTSGWSWAIFAVLALLSAVWVTLAIWQSTPRKPVRPLGAPALSTSHGEFVARPDLTGQIVRQLLAGRSKKVGITTGITGAGGFGKTTLAQEVISLPEITTAFDWIGWVTVGQEPAGAALADIINDVSERVEQQRPGLTRPEQAGMHLGALLKDRGNSLLVVDDVWTAQQLQPFLSAGRGCTLLITTRVPSLLPADSEPVTVDQMTRQQARDLLTHGLAELPEPLREQLLDITGLWPLALKLSNSALRSSARTGSAVEATARDLLRRLRDRGPAALDARRERAVGTTLEASLGLLGDRRDQVVELAIFPEDMEIPQELVALLWARTAGLSADEADLLCGELAQLSVISRVGDPARLRLHDVVRSYLRHECGSERLVSLHNGFLAAVAATLPESDQRPIPWWTMPMSAEHMWRTLAYHLAGARRTAELAILVSVPLWVIRKLSRFGPVAVAEDLAMADTDKSRELSRFLEQVGHLLTPTTPDMAVVNALAHRLGPYSALHGLRAAALRETEGIPRLTPRRAMPDLPDPALNRVLVGHDGEVMACVFAPDGSWLATGSADRTIRIWHPETGQLMHLLETQRGICECAVSADGKWLASTGTSGQAHVWDTAKWQVHRVLTGHRDRVNGCTFSLDGRTLITVSDDKTIRVWDLETGHQLRSLSTPKTVRKCALLTGGRVLGIDTHGAKIWDLSTGKHVDLDHPRDYLSIKGCAVSPDGTWGVTASKDGLTIHDLTVSGGPPRVLRHQKVLNAVTFSPDGSTLVAGGEDGSITIWSVHDWRVRGRIVAHASGIRTLSYASDGSAFASASKDGTVRLWNPHLATGEHAQPSGGSIRSCVAAVDGSWLAVSTRDEVVVHDSMSGELREVLDFMMSGRPVAVSPVTDSLLVGRFRDVLICEAGNWRNTRVLRHPTDSLISQMSTGGPLLCVGSYGDGMAVWDITTLLPPVILEATADGMTVRRGAKPRKLIPRKSPGVTAVTMEVAPTGEWAAVSAAGVVRIVETSTWTTKTTLVYSNAYPDILAVAPNGQWLAVVEDRQVQIWDTGSWALDTGLDAHRSTVTNVAWSPSGDLLATVTEDRAIRIFGGSRWECLTELRVDGELTDCAWLDEARVVAVGGRGIYWFDWILPQGEV